MISMRTMSFTCKNKHLRKRFMLATVYMKLSFTQSLIELPEAGKGPYYATVLKSDSLSPTNNQLFL